MSPAPCTNCGGPRKPRSGSHGWCGACYFRWYRAGADPKADPPPPKRIAVTPEVVEDCQFLLDSGSTIEEAAARVGVPVRRLAPHLLPPPEPAECRVEDCPQEATHHRRWCDQHRDPAKVYAAFRADGLTRRQAAARTGVNWRNTYKWEPGRPGVGRPRTRTAVNA